MRRRIILVAMMTALFVQVAPSSAETTRTAPFDGGIVCGNFGVPGLAYPVYQPGPYLGYTCAGDPQYFYNWDYGIGFSYNNPAATAARNGVLTVGGWDYVCGTCAGLPPYGYLAGIYEASSVVWLYAPAGTAKTVTAAIDPTTIRVDEFERELRLCLAVYETSSYTPAATDCFGKGQAVRDLSISFTTAMNNSVYPAMIKVSLLTSNDLGAGSVTVDSITIT